MQAVSDALSSSRLVTLVGLGGAGKTRLAVEVARRLAPIQRDGVRVAEFASVASAPGVLATILATLDPPGGPSGPGVEAAAVARLVAVLRSRELVLVRLLGTCPQLTVLATSREPLRIAGEVVSAVDPLAVSPSSLRHPPPAVAPFVARAATSHRGFELSEDNLDHVTAICELVDGIPLAIEIAAARAGQLSTAEIRDRLLHHPGSLASQDPTASDRHRTLTATLDWAVTGGDTALALELASATWRAWEQTGRHAEGRQILSETLRLASDTSVHRARALAEEALTRFQAQGNAGGVRVRPDEPRHDRDARA